MSLSLFFFGVVSGIIASAIFVAVKNSKNDADSSQYAMDLDDFNPFEPICNGKNSTNWDSVKVCPDCLYEVSHDEIMAHICKTCGNANMSYEYVARREIVRDGKWVEQLRIGHRHFLDKKEIKRSDYE